jgi:hypothetical protein
MEANVTADPKALGRGVAALQSSAKALGEAFRTATKMDAEPEKHAFLIDAELAKIDKALATLGEAPGLRQELTAWTREVRARVEPIKDRVRSLLAAALAKELAAFELTVEGNLPELRCSVLTLELLFDKAEVRIFYGPRIELLGKAKLDPKPAAEAVKAALDELSKQPLDPKEFLQQTREAWQRAARLAGEDPAKGPTIGVVEVLEQLALLKQGKSFRANPTRENFTSYGRVQWSWDLYRLSERRLGDEELRLTVATREQTKSEATSLWVPRTARGEGTHIGSLAFRKVS